LILYLNIRSRKDLVFGEYTESWEWRQVVLVRKKGWRVEVWSRGVFRGAVGLQSKK
jgi:hypothetical protein